MSTDALRCARCGVQSPEPTCFIVPARHSKPPHYIRCLTCEQRRLAPTTAASIGAASFALFLPVLVAFLSSNEPQGGKAAALGLLAVVVSFPAAIVAHELGHAVAGWALGLEVAAVEIGFGRTLWQFRICDLPVQIHAWLLSGRVLLGSPSLSYLRTRLWLSTAAGPLVNAVLVAVTVHFWLRLVLTMGTAVPAIWLIVNAMLCGGSLFPYHLSALGRQHDSDGLSLLKTPRKTDSQLMPLLRAAPLVRAWYAHQVDDFVGAKAAAEKALSRAPQDLVAKVLLCVALLDLQDPSAAVACLMPSLEDLMEKKPAERALVWSTLALALLVDSARDPKKQADLGQAGRMSHDAYRLYPCILEYRATYAIFLATTQRGAEALELLEYMHYRTGTDKQRSYREVARAIAFRQLGRTTEASESSRVAESLDPSNAHLLRDLVSTKFAAAP